MNRPVDVLAVIKRDAMYAEAYWIAHSVVDGNPHAMAQESKQAIAYISELIEAAKSASATLGHAYHTVLCGELSEQAHADYQRLDAAISSTGNPRILNEWMGEIECCAAKGFWLIATDDCPFVPGQKVTISSCWSNINNASSVNAFDRWWYASKYMQVVFSGDPTKQAARDGFEAGLRSGAALARVGGAA